jgi:hypothetical protein
MDDGRGTMNPTQIPSMESNPTFASVFAPSIHQSIHHMGKYSNYKKFENIFPQWLIGVH